MVTDFVGVSLAIQEKRRRLNSGWNIKTDLPNSNDFGSSSGKRKSKSGGGGGGGGAAAPAGVNRADAEAIAAAVKELDDAAREDALLSIEAQRERDRLRSASLSIKPHHKSKSKSNARVKRVSIAAATDASTDTAISIRSDDDLSPRSGGAYDFSSINPAASDGGVRGRAVSTPPAPLPDSKSDALISTAPPAPSAAGIASPKPTDFAAAASGGGTIAILPTSALGGSSWESQRSSSRSFSSTATPKSNASRRSGAGIILSPAARSIALANNSKSATASAAVSTPSSRAQSSRRPARHARSSSGEDMTEMTAVDADGWAVLPTTNERSTDGDSKQQPIASAFSSPAVYFDKPVVPLEDAGETDAKRAI